MAKKKVVKNLKSDMQVKLSQAAKWQCKPQFEALSEVKEIDRGEKQVVVPQELTVGQKFQLICSGETLAFNPAKLQLVPIKNGREDLTSFALQLIETKRVDPQELDLVVTSFVSGNHRLSFFLQDGENTALVENLQLSLQSVITKKEKKQEEKSGWKQWFSGQEKEKTQEQLPAVQQPTPYPAYGLVKPPLPLMYIIFCGVLVFGGLIWLGIFIYQRIKYKQQKLELRRQQTALGAFNQMNKELRLLEREQTVGGKTSQQSIEELNTIFRMYLVREFVVPALEWSDRRLVSCIAKENPTINPKLIQKLRLLLRELRPKQEAKLSARDIQQILQSGRQLFEKLSRNKKKGAK